jgi:hypothetical protein
MTAQRRHVPRVRSFEVLREGTSSERHELARRTPHLDRIGTATLRETPQQRRHVANMIRVQMRQEQLRRRRHRQTQPVEVRQRPRAEIEEEEVAFVVADFDEHRRRRLALFTNGSPLPRIVTRISPEATGSTHGSNTLAYERPGVPITGVVVNASALPS